MTGADAPTWLAEGCPAWCAREHLEDDHPEDRYHHSEPSLVPAVAAAADTVPVTASLESMTLVVWLGRHVGTSLVWVAVEPAERREPRLVLTEESARALHEHLGRQLALAAT